MTIKDVILALLGFGIFLSCQKGMENMEIDPSEIDNSPINKAVFSGYVQKGPFINGSSVMISELDKNLDQTGKTYFTTISDNLGSFEKKNIELVSGYVSLKADGYYFNEVSGETSTGQITLYALVDLVDVNSANVNVLTHLERARVEYLVQEESLNFIEAKKQARKEILDIFGFSIKELSTFELLDLKNDAVLLAISCILQGLLSTGEMAELMADIITDIRADGILDNPDLKTKLIDNAILVPLTSVRDNMASKYAELGMDVVIPDFESYVTAFIGDNISPSISYPETGLYGGINILSDAVTSVTKVNNDGIPFYSMSADVPKGLSLKIIIRNEHDVNAVGAWAIWIAPDQPVNWKMGQYDSENQSQEFTIMEYENQSDLKMLFAAPNFTDEPQYITIEYYENGSETPTKVKRLYMEEPEKSDDEKLVDFYYNGAYYPDDFYKDPALPEKSVHYVNTISITPFYPIEQEHAKHIELSTNDKNEALSWVNLACDNYSSGVSYSIIEERETEKYFEYKCEGIADSHIMLFRVHKTNYYLPVFDAYAWNDDDEKEYGYYNAEITESKIKECLEYLWIHTFSNLGEKVFSSEITETEDYFEVYINSLRPGGWGQQDYLIVYDNYIRFNKGDKLITFRQSLQKRIMDK
jgi:hypothetical protein